MFTKTLTLTATRLFSGYLAERAIGKVVKSTLPDPDAEETRNAPLRIQIETIVLYAGGMLATAMITNYVSSAITTYVEKMLWPEGDDGL